MTLHVVALETEQFRERFFALPNKARQGGTSVEVQAANHILKCCVDDCQITRFSGDIEIPGKNVFAGWAEALPDVSLLSECQRFLCELQSPSRAKQATMPWWIKSASFNVSLVDPQSVRRFCDASHACKFFEIFLANVVSGNAAPQFIELGEFLELSAINNCGVLAWSTPG